MAFNYKKVLLIGATSGIGLALATTLVENGIYVILIGRRKENLDDFISQHGRDKADTRVFDIKNIDQASTFTDEVFGAHPDIDFVLLNSGIQRGFNFGQPSTVDLAIFNEELLTNYTAPIHLTTAILPYLQKQSKPTCIAYTSSSLAIVPIPRCLNYCATKAALHAFALSLREQLSHGPGDVRVIEILPPAVQTELHDPKHQPDLKGGAAFGVPLAEYTADLWKQLGEGTDEIVFPAVRHVYDAVEPKRQELFHQFVEMITKMAEKTGQ